MDFKILCASIAITQFKPYAHVQSDFDATETNHTAGWCMKSYSPSAIPMTLLT